MTWNGEGEGGEEELLSKAIHTSQKNERVLRLVLLSTTQAYTPLIHARK